MARSKDSPQINRIGFAPTSSKSFAKRFGSNIRVGRKDYRLVFCDQIVDETGERVAGLCDPNDHAIYVDIGREVEATLLHELAHAEIYEAGFHQRSDWCSDLEEQIVEVVSQSIAHSFKLQKKTSPKKPK